MGSHSIILPPIGIGPITFTTETNFVKYQECSYHGAMRMVYMYIMYNDIYIDVFNII